MAALLDLAFIGCGEATRSHARTLRHLDPAVRLHFASRDPRKAADFSRRYGGSGAFGSYREAMEARVIDAVVLATPPIQHRSQALAALEAGKAVVVEKPAFLGAADFEDVHSAAASVGRQVYVAENYYYKPLTETLRSLLAEGRVGEPLVLQLNAVKRQRASGWRADPELVGGGALLEGGIHWVNLMANIGLDVEDVSGFSAGRSRNSTPEGAGPAPDGTGPTPDEAGRAPEGAGPAPPGRPERSAPRSSRAPVEETTVLVMRYRGGAVGVLTFSWEVPSTLHGVRLSTLFGREGTLRFESNGLFAMLSGRHTRPIVPGLRDLSGRRAMWADFLDSMRSGRPPRMTLDKAAADLRWVRRASESHGT